MEGASSGARCFGFVAPSGAAWVQGGERRVRADLDVATHALVARGEHGRARLSVWNRVRSYAGPGRQTPAVLSVPALARARSDGLPPGECLLAECAADSRFARTD